MNFGARIYDPSIGRFLSVDPLLDFFPNQTPYSYAYNNPISYRDPSGLAPEGEKGNKNQIQGWFFVITNSCYEFLVEEGIICIAGEPVQPKKSDKGRDGKNDGNNGIDNSGGGGSGGGSGGSSSSGSGAGIGSVGMGAGVNVAPTVNGDVGSGLGGGVLGSMQYSFSGQTLNVNYRVNTQSDIANAQVQISNSLNWIANAGDYGRDIMNSFINAMNIRNISLYVNLTQTGKNIADLYKRCDFDGDFVLGFSSNIWYYDDASSSRSGCDLDIPDKSLLPIYIAKEYLTGIDNTYRFTNWKIPYDFPMVFSHEFKHKYDSMIYLFPIERESSAIKFTRDILIWYYFR
ncbi:MAG: hypothetical protein A2X64_00445 [Ignavibacteria bacterium GWF2_33_9]|nr:MAG: hypothetical protein A2X64_00445 [Ignavibacteria bacterium GWF2_33_9]